MKTKSKKMIGMTAILGMTALTSTFAASSSTIHTQTPFHKGGKRSGREMKTLTGEERKAEQEHVAENLAAVLGITKEKVQADLAANKTVMDIIKSSGQDTATALAKLQQAHDADMKAQIAAGVASGKITQAKADKMEDQKADRKKTDGLNAGKGFDKTKMIQDMATVLNIPSSTILSQISAGKKPIDIVTASGVSQLDFEKKMKALYMAEIKIKLQEEVNAGNITQADADSKLAKIASHKEGMKGMKSKVHAIKSATTTNQ